MVEKILLDTDALIKIEGKREAFKQVKGTFLMVSVISAYEFLFGEAYIGENVKTVKNSFEALVDILGIDQKILLKTIDIDITLTKRGKKLPFRDLVIGATAIIYDIPLLSENRKHFVRLQEFGLQLISFDELV